MTQQSVDRIQAELGKLLEQRKREGWRQGSGDVALCPEVSITPNELMELLALREKLINQVDSWGDQ